MDLNEKVEKRQRQRQGHDKDKVDAGEHKEQMVKGIRNLHPNGIFALQHIQPISSALDWKNMTLFSWL